MSNVKLVVSIIQFLKDEAAKEGMSADTRESLEVAVQCLQTAYDLEPNDPRLHHRETLSLEDVYDIASACTAPSAYIEATGDDETEDPLRKAEVMKNFGNNLMKRNLYADAVRYYSAAIELDGRNAIYYGNRAAAYSKLNDFKNAVSDCERAVHIDPLYAKAYGRLGLAYASLGRHDEAVSVFKRALELDPDNESYKSNLKIAQEKAEKPQTTPPSMPGPLASLAQVDWQTLFSNPTFRNMASTLMQDPHIINALTANIVTGLNPSAMRPGNTGEGGTAPEPDSTNMDMLIEAGQYLAAQMQATNPDLIEQFRQSTSRNNNNSQDPDDKNGSTTQ